MVIRAGGVRFDRLLFMERRRSENSGQRHNSFDHVSANRIKKKSHFYDLPFMRAAPSLLKNPISRDGRLKSW